MAAQITLVRRDDFQSDVDSLSLWNYANGISIDVDGWAPARPVPSDERVTEALTLRTKGTSPDNLAANLQALDGYLQKVSWYNNPQELYGVWLRVQQPRETGARQALVLSARRDPLPIWSHTAQDGPGTVAAYHYGNVVQAYGLALERTPYWESDSYSVFDGMGSVSSVGGTAQLRSSGGGGTVIAGDVPARLALVEFIGLAGGGGPLAQFWLGLRSNRFGVATNFQSTWSLHQASYLQASSTAGGGTATATTDAQARDGTAVVCGFADGALSRRITMQVVDVSAFNYLDQRGTFLVLLRAKLSAAGQVNVRLADGLYLSPTFGTRDRVPVTGTDYAFYELGTVHLPSPGRLIGTYDAVRAYALGLDAERVSGTPTLTADCLVLIPVDEGWLSATLDGSTGKGVEFDAALPSGLFVSERADGSRDSTFFHSSVPQMVGVPRGSGGVPVGSSVILVMAAQRQTGATTFLSTLTDTAFVQIQSYERWESMRGAAA